MDKARSKGTGNGGKSSGSERPPRVDEPPVYLSRKRAEELVRFHSVGTIRTFLEQLAKEILCGGVAVQAGNAAILAGSHAIKTFQVEDELAERAHKRRLGASPEELAAKIAELREEQRMAERAQARIAPPYHGEREDLS